MRRSLIMKATAAGHAATTLADASTAQAATDDPFYSKLWGLQQIHAEQAWAQTTAVGSVVAAVDTGTTPWPIWRVRFCQGRPSPGAPVLVPAAMATSAALTE